MSSYENQKTKISNPDILNIKNKNNLKLENNGQFNSFKFKHFNNFFNNLFYDRLKSELINYLSDKDNNTTSIFKNEFLNETFSEKTLSDFNEKRKKIKLNDNIMSNTKLKSIDLNPYNKNNRSTYNNSKNKIYLSKINKSKSNNKSSSINSKILGKEQKLIHKISNNKTFGSNSKIKLKLDISSISNNWNNNMKNKFCNTSESYFKKMPKMNKAQQLPKDAANCLLLFLKKNKTYLQKTSKYYPIYEKYENIIDNIIDNIPNEENRNKKNNLDNFLGYYNRKPIEGNNVLDSACLIWKNYKSKSEKQRHVQILSELTKLKGYLEKDENKKILYIKDFLNKYSINYDNNKISLFEKFMDDFDVKNYEKFLEPGLGIKDMITKIFDKGEKFIMENNKNEEKKEIPPVINLKSNINNNNNNNENPKKGIESYLAYNRNNSFTPNHKQKILNLSDTNSYLKEMERQKLVDKPNKTYTSNYNLIVNDIGKEICQLEAKIIKEKQYKSNLLNKRLRIKNMIKNNDNFFITLNKNNKQNKNKSKNNYISSDKIVNKRKRYDRKNTRIIIQKLNVQSHFDKVELKDIRRKLKLTEYIIYNKAKKRLKLKELGQDELYEYASKEDKKFYFE